MRRPESNKPEPKPPTEDDLFADHLREQCARAIVAHVKNSKWADRAMKSLNLAEYAQLAEACTAHWIKLVSRRNAEAPRTAQTEVYRNLLMG